MLAVLRAGMNATGRMLSTAFVWMYQLVNMGARRWRHWEIYGHDKTYFHFHLHVFPHIYGIGNFDVEVRQLDNAMASS